MNSFGFIALLWLVTDICPVAAAENSVRPPEFRMLVTEDRLPALIAETDTIGTIRKIREQPGLFPDLGCLAASVSDRGQAAGVGMAAGSVYFRRGDAPCLPDFMIRADFNPINRPAGELIWIDPTGSRKSAQVNEGKINVYFEPYRNMVAWYLSHGTKDSRWDNAVVAALIYQAKDSTVSESLWALACKQGYKANRLSNFCGMYLAMAERDIARATTFARAFGPLKSSAEAGDVPHFPTDWEQLALLTGDPTWIAESAGYFSGEYAAKVKGPLQLQMALHSKAKPGLPSPSVLADAMKRRSFLKDADFKSAWAGSFCHVARMHQKAVASSNAGRDNFPAEIFEAPLEHNRKTWIGPAKPAKNIDATVTFRARGADLGPTKKCTFKRGFHFGLANRTYTDRGWSVIPRTAGILVTDLGFGTTEMDMREYWNVYVPAGDSDSELQARLGKWTQTQPRPPDMLPPFNASGATAHKLRVVRVEGQAEALLDGKRLALVQIPDGLDDPGVIFMVVGAQIIVTGFTADILE